MSSQSSVDCRKSVLQLDNVTPRWFAVYTRYKREKLLVRKLKQKGIHAYVPLQKLTRHYTRKKKQVELPLINCYVFVKITRSEYVPVLQEGEVIEFVKFKGDLVAIPEREIDILRKIVGEGIAVEVSTEQFRIGEEAEIIGGQLTGLRGKIVEPLGDKNFIIELDSLGYSLRMQVPVNYLQRSLVSPGFK